MPEQEFEIYLSLLSKLLKLNPAQKAAISDELRCHLEERLEALMQTGISREQAIRLAMEEFGDVSGLAIDLTQASRTPLRKVAMRSTIAASIIAALIVGWLTLFVPEHRIAAPPAVQAESHPAATDQTKPVEPTNSPLRDMLSDPELFPEFLTKTTNVTWNDGSLREALQDLETMHQVPIVIDRAALDEEGIEPSEVMIKLNLKDLTFEEVLNILTRQVRLIWQSDGSVIQITTPERARFLRREFDVHSLLKAGHGMGRLIMLMTNLTGTSWWPQEENGGSLVPVANSLIVRQTYKDIRQIAQLFALIDSSRTPIQVLGICSNRDRLVKMFAEPASLSVDSQPMSEVIESLSRQYRFTYVVSQGDLDSEGIGFDQPISVKATNRPLGKLLEELLDNQKLTYVVHDGVIEITTISSAEKHHELVVYDVHDLLESGVTFGQLFSAITTIIRTQWFPQDEEGGRMQFSDAVGLLFVKHTEKIQDEVKTLIGQLQRTQKRYQVEMNKVANPSPEQMVLKVYELQHDSAQDFVTAIPRLVAPESWFIKQNEVDGPQIAVVASMLVIRQTHDIHRQVQNFLTSIRVANQVRVLNPASDSESRQHGPGIGGTGGGMMGGGMGGMGGGMF